MNEQGTGMFKFHVGIDSLAQVATREDRVCVLNILGSESSAVTPVGHAYSGGNVVFGTSPGRRFQLLNTTLGGPRHEKDRFCGVPTKEILGSHSLSDLAYLALLGQDPGPRRPLRIPDFDQPASQRQRPGSDQHSRR